MKTLIAVAAAAFVASSLATAGSAEPPRREAPAMSEQISYTDLNLSSAVGQKRLRDRISFAAYRLCLMDSTATPSPAVDDPVCYRGAMDDGLSQMQRAVAGAESNRAVGYASSQQRR